MEEFKINKLSFVKRPISIPPEYRPLYKIGLIVLILKLCCRGEKSNLLKLHLFSWALTSEKNMCIIREYLESNFQSDFSVWGIEPTLNRALQFAISENICGIIDGRTYALAEKGNQFFNLINSDTLLFEKEKVFLKFVGKIQLTDTRINAMTKKWTLFNAEN
jgi:hypothetical protein